MDDWCKSSSHRWSPVDGLCLRFHLRNRRHRFRHWEALMSAERSRCRHSAALLSLWRLTTIIGQTGLYLIWGVSTVFYQWGKAGPFCQPPSPSPDACVPRLGPSAASFLTRCARRPRGTEASWRCNKGMWIGWRGSKGSLTFSEVWKKGFGVTADWQDSAEFYFRNALVRLQYNMIYIYIW